MLSHKIILATLLLATSASAYDFKTANGTTWRFTIPPNWRILDTQEAIAEGVAVRLGSTNLASAAYINPNSALIAIVFKGQPSLPQTNTINGKPVNQAITPNGTKVITATVETKPITIFLQNNGLTTADADLASILASITEVKP